MNGALFPDHVVRYRLIAPEEVLTAAADASDVLVFDRCEDAWKQAAYRTLSGPVETGQGEDRALVAKDLLDCDETGAMHAWCVARWAKTLQHPKTTAHRLNPAWLQEGITLTHHEGMDDTHVKVVTLLVNDLMPGDFYGIDAAVVTQDWVWMGVIVSVTSTGELTFADGQTVNAIEADQITVQFR
jgi:hypothetical protein